MRDADIILHVNTDEINADVLIAAVIRKFSQSTISNSMNLLYLLILYGKLYFILHAVLYQKYIVSYTKNLKIL